MKNKGFDKAISYVTIALAAYFFIRLADFSKLINHFPVHYTADIPAYMAQLDFLSKYGFHQIVPTWFNGLILFLRYPPGWYYFTLPLYWLTNEVTLATYISIVISFIMLFISIHIFGKSQNLSPAKRTAFFFLLFGNAITIGNFLRLGRPPELFTWIWFIAIAGIMLWYKDHRVNKNFLWIIPVYAILILSHPTLNVFFHLLFLWPMLLLIKKDLKERIIIALSAFSGLFISSFWWFPFAKDSLQTKLSSIPLGVRMLSLDYQPLSNFILNNLASIAISLIFLLTFYLYWTPKKSKKDLFFFFPMIVLSILFLFRVTSIIPPTNIPYPDIYFVGLLFFSLYFLFKTPLTKTQQKIVLVLLAVFVLSNIAVSTLHTSWFPEYTPVEYSTFSVLGNVTGKYLIVESPYPTSYPYAYYSYGAVYHDLETPHGMGTEGLLPEYQEHVLSVIDAVKIEDCKEIIKLSYAIDYTELIAYNQECQTLKQCDFEEIYTSEPVCLYKVR